MDWISILIVAFVTAFLVDQYYSYMMHYPYYWRIGKRNSGPEIEMSPILEKGKRLMDKICENPIKPENLDYCRSKLESTGQFYEIKNPGTINSQMSPAIPQMIHMP